MFASVQCTRKKALQYPFWFTLVQATYWLKTLQVKQFAISKKIIKALQYPIWFNKRGQPSPSLKSNRDPHCCIRMITNEGSSGIYCDTVARRSLTGNANEATNYTNYCL